MKKQSKKAAFIVVLVSGYCVVGNASAAVYAGPGPGSVFINGVGSWGDGYGNTYSGSTGNNYYGSYSDKPVMEVKDKGIYQTPSNVKIIGAGQVNLLNGGVMSVGSYFNLGDRLSASKPGQAADQLQLNVLSGSRLTTGSFALGRGVNDRFIAVVDGEGSSLSTGWGEVGKSVGGWGTLIVRNKGLLNSSDAIVVARTAAGDASVLNVENSGIVKAKDIFVDGEVSIGSGANVAATNALTIQDSKAIVTIHNDDGGQSLITPKIAFIMPGTLNIDTNGPAESILNSAIEGAGNVNKVGDGITRLTGDTSKFSGLLTVSQGGLIADENLGSSDSIVNVSGSGVLSGTGDILGDLNLNQGGAYQGSGAIKGDMAVDEGGVYNGSGEVSGNTDLNGMMLGSSKLTGQLNIGRTGNYQGSGDVLGAANVSGLMGGSSNIFGKLTISEFGRYEGTGIINDDLVVLSNAVLSPGGDAVGTSTVEGNTIFEDGAAYAVSVKASGESDLILTKADVNRTDSGKTIIGNDVEVRVSAIDPQKDYRQSQVYTILKSENGIEGNFSKVVPMNDFLTGEIDRQDNYINLGMRVKSPDAFRLAAITKNQYSVAGALSGLRATGDELSLFNKVLSLGGDFSSARSAFDALSGEFYASAKTALVRNEFSLGQKINQQMLSSEQGAHSSSSSVWVKPYSDNSRFDAGHGVEALTASREGVLVGADIPVFEDARVGVMVGTSHSKAKVSALSSKNSSDDYHFGLYGSKDIGMFSLRGGAIYGSSHINSKRDIEFPGYSDTVKGSYDAETLQTYAEVDYKIKLREVTLKPFLNVSRVDVRTSNVKEKGGAGALNVKKDTFAVNTSTAGVRSFMPFKVKDKNASIYATLGWQHAFGDIEPDATMSFGSGENYTVSGSKLARDAAVAGVGANIEILKNISLEVGYSGSYGSENRNNGVDATVKMVF